MVVNAESATGAVLAGKSDSRITKVGAFLRATRIDELPQLLNILNGDMTLVGPRPERPEFYQKYCAEYPEFAYRLRAKAGLTGYAQLYGKYNTTFADKALLDMYYIQKASFLWGSAAHFLYAEDHLRQGEHRGRGHQTRRAGEERTGLRRRNQIILLLFR